MTHHIQAAENEVIEFIWKYYFVKISKIPWNILQSETQSGKVEAYFMTIILQIHHGYW